jgi:hypothetical protein
MMEQAIVRALKRQDAETFRPWHEAWGDFFKDEKYASQTTSWWR